MSRLSMGITSGVVAGLLGIVISLLPFGVAIEENLGLALLFKLRGTRQAPDDVVIISIDKQSSDELGLPEEPRKWPRSIYAGLVENLSRKDVRVIVFDIFFEEPHSADEDKLFSSTMNKSHNVALSARLRRDIVSLTNNGGSPHGDIGIVKFITPTTSLGKAAAGIAPFPLPKAPLRVNQYWTFMKDAGDMPTLPLVAFHIYALDIFHEFIPYLEKSYHDISENLSYKRDVLNTQTDIKKLMQVLRNIFDNNSAIADAMLRELDRPAIGTEDGEKNRTIKSLIHMYQSPGSQYLNFYGPPRTIKTIPYYQALEMADNDKYIDLKGKAVFVGVSDIIHHDQKDSYNTVYSTQDGSELSGVEIAATAFANILEDIPVKPAGLWIYIPIILCWGLLLGIICRIFPAFISTVIILLLSLVYLVTAVYQFRISGTWYPVFIPLAIQLPGVLVYSVIYNFIAANKERQNIKQAFGYYLPNDVVNQLSMDISSIKIAGQKVYGICLYTDAEGYTAMSESMSPEDLSSFLNIYCETIFEPVKQHNGIVSNIIGDSVLAIWVGANSGNSDLIRKACLAAMDIARSVDKFNQTSKFRLPIRIGIHAGDIMLSNVGAIDHYEYRPVGDIVNTTTRLEGLNKYLGTNILVSGDAINNTDCFFTREAGRFLFVGKSQPLTVYELICCTKDIGESQKEAYKVFAEALAFFKKQSWEEAVNKFNESIRLLGEDGLSQFYINQCNHNKNNMPSESWDGLIRLDKK